MFPRVTNEANRPLELGTNGLDGAAVRRRRPPAEARDEIAQAANAFLQAHRFRDMTVEAVMRRTQMARPSFYVYFSGRHDVVAHLVQDAARELLEVANATCDTPGAPVDRLDGFLHAFVDACCEKRHVIRAMADAACTCEDIERTRDELVLGTAACVARMMRSDHADGDRDWPDPESAALALVSMLEGYLLHAAGMRDVSVALGTVSTVWRRLLMAA